MSKPSAYEFLWFGTLVGLVLWTTLSYVGTPSPELRQEILLRHSLLVIAISLPLGAVAALLVGALIHGLSLTPTAMQDAWLTSIACVSASYIQWFVLVPRLLRKWTSRA